MKKRRIADEVARLFRVAYRDLAKGLSVSDIGRKLGIALTTDCCWRQKNDPTQVDADRQCREVQTDAERLKRLTTMGAEPTNFGTERNRQCYEGLSPEGKAAVARMRAANRTPEARAKFARIRELADQEFAPVSPDERLLG